MKKIIFLISMTVGIISLMFTGCNSSNVSSQNSKVSEVTTETEDYTDAIPHNGAVIAETSKTNSSAVDIYYDALMAIDRKNDKILATVDGKPICASQIREGIIRMDLQINHNLYLSDDMTSKEKEEYKNKYAITEKEGLEEFIKTEVINQTAEKL